ncbi:MAG: YHS domain-containing (seleno)protein [Pseudomonadota bacterium]
MTPSRRAFLIGLAATPAALAALPAVAAEPPVFQSNGVAINGYDPVAYFTESRPVEGSADHTSMHDGATFQFASAANKAMFDADPAAFAPQYGGYCAFAVSKGYTAKTDPDAWTVHNGKLYLNFNRLIRARWAVSKDSFIADADANWPAVLG